MNERTRQQAAKMGSKVHYRAYKVGKRWLVAGISSLALAGVLFGAGATQASAATDETGSVDDQASQTTTAGGTLNQQEVALASSADKASTAVSANSEMKADTGTVAETMAPEVSASEVTADSEAPAAVTGEQAVANGDTTVEATANDANVAVDDVQTYNLGTASDEVADATKAQAAQAYATTGQAQKVTRVADAVADATDPTDAAVEMGSISITMQTTDGALVMKSTSPIVTGQLYNVISSDMGGSDNMIITDEMVTMAKQQAAELLAAYPDATLEFGDDITGKYDYVSVKNETTGVETTDFSKPMAVFIDPDGIKDYAFTITVRKTPLDLVTTDPAGKAPVEVDHVYLDGSDATGATSSPKQVILTVVTPITGSIDDMQLLNEENTITINFEDDGSAAVTSDKMPADTTDTQAHLLSTILGQNGVTTVSGATIQQNLRNMGIRMDGTVDPDNTNLNGKDNTVLLSPNITKVTYVYDQDAVAETPATDANQDMLDKLKDLYDQAMSDFGNDAKHIDDTFDASTPLPGQNEGGNETVSDGQANVGVAIYIKDAETGAITPFDMGGGPLVDWHLYDKDTTIPLDMTMSYEGVNYRYVGYEVAPADGSVDGSKLNPNNSLPVKTGALVAGVDETGAAIEVAPTTLMNAIYEVVPAEITANYIYDDADQTQVKPTQTVTPDQASDVTLPTTNLEKIVLTSGNGKNGVLTTLTLKFNSDFTVTHLILNEGTDNEFILPVAAETLGTFLDANEAGADLSQAVLDDLAGSGIGEDATSPDVYQGFLANLAKTGIHINGNVTLSDPETYTQLKDVTYVYATPDKQPVTIEAVDDVTGDVLETAELAGYPDFTTTYDTQALIDKYTAMNYVVAANDIPEVITFDDDSTASQVYQLHLTHHVTHSTAETTQTVTFTDEGGKTMAPSVDETITWNVSTDDVTGDKVATAQKSYDAVDAPVIEGYVATPTVVAATYPAATKGELADTTVQVIYKKKVVAGDGVPTTPGGTDVTQPGTDQSTGTTPEAEQPTVVEPGGETAPEADQPGTGEQPAAGVDGEDAETPETVASNGTATGNVEAANGQALTSRVAGSQASNADAQRLPQTAERDGRVGSVMGLALAGMLSLLGLSGLRKKRD